jgi:hypothetical protein
VVKEKRSIISGSGFPLKETVSSRGNMQQLAAGVNRRIDLS